MNDLRQILQRNPMFGNLKDADLEQITALMISRTFTPGEIIFLEGEPNTGLWIVGRGRVRVYRIAPSGKEQVLCLMGPSTCFGCCPLFDRDTYPANAQAVDDVVLYILPRMEALILAEWKPELSEALLRLFAGRLRHLTRVAEGLAFNCVTGRLAGVLLEQAAEHGIDTGQRIEVEINLNQDELAALIGTTGQIIGRALRRLEHMRAIHTQGQRIIIMNCDVLHRLAAKV